MEQSRSLSRPPLVLVANAEEWTSRSLETILGPAGYAVVRAFTGMQAIEIVGGIAPDAILISAKLPDDEGIAVCRRLRAHPAIGATTPILLTTCDALSRSEQIRFFEAGAWECLRMPFDGDLLLLRLANLIRARREVLDLRAASLVDEASGLYSFRGLTQRVQEMAADAARRRGPLACVALAPEAGDVPVPQEAIERVAAQIAEHVAHALRRHGRASDVIGRLSQFEFGLLTPTDEREGVVKMVDRLCTVLDEQPAMIDGRARTVCMKVGYAVVSDFAAASVDPLGLILQASTALRHARARGDNRSIVGYDELQAGVLH